MNAKTLLFGIAAAALISAGTAYAQGPRPPKDDHNNGVRLAADIVKLHSFNHLFILKSCNIRVVKRNVSVFTYPQTYYIYRVFL